MRISITDARGRLAELVRRSQAGDEVILTRRGVPVVQLVAAQLTSQSSAQVSTASKRALLEAVRASGRAKADDGPSAARSQDFLYE